MGDLIDLSSKRVESKKLYKHTKEVVDNRTGEVIKSINSFVKKEKTKDSFIKLFVDNIAYLVENCSSNARTVFWVMLRSVNYNNVFIYSSGFVDYFVSNKILGKSSVYAAIKELETKQVIFRLTNEDLQNFDIAWGNSKNCFLINSQIIGRGTFNDIEELRHITTKTFNFNTLEMKQEFTIEAKYEGLDEVIQNSDRYEVDSIKRRHSKNSHEIEVVVAEKENASQPQSYHVINVKQSDKTANSNALIEHKEPSLFDEPASDKATDSVIFKLAGILNGVIDPNITAKEIKAQRLSKYE